MDIRERRRMAGIYLKALFAPYETGYIEIRAIKAGAPPRQEWFWIPNLRGTGLKNAKQRGEYLGEIVDFGIRQCDQEFDVYVGVLPRGRETEKGKAKTGQAADIYHAAWMWADVDFKNVEPDKARETLKGADMLVCSGGGLHGYWQAGAVLNLTHGRKDYWLGEAVVREVDTISLFEAAMRKRHEAVGSDPVHDLPRILRLPGTQNFKIKNQPRPVVLERCVTK